MALAWPEAVMTIVSPAWVITDGTWTTIVESEFVEDGSWGDGLEALVSLFDPLLESSAAPTLLSYPVR